MVRLQAPGRDGARRHRGRGGVARTAEVGRSLAYRHQRLELRRVHGQLRAHAQQALRDGNRGRLGHRLEGLRLGLHRTLHVDAAEQRGRVRAVGTARRRQGPERATAARPRHDGRQRAHAEHDSVRVRTREGGQAVRVDAVSHAATRRERPATREAHASDDARVRAENAETGRCTLGRDAHRRAAAGLTGGLWICVAAGGWHARRVLDRYAARNANSVLVAPADAVAVSREL